MTLPNERYRAVNQAREFLRDLLDRKKTPGVPSKVRQEAYWVLRHFPSEFDMERAVDGQKEIFEKEEKARLSLELKKNFYRRQKNA